MELSVTPAVGLRLCKASGVSINKEKSCNEPGMQVGQWGAAASATSVVHYWGQTTIISPLIRALI
jgi:hypothetical protein